MDNVVELTGVKKYFMSNDAFGRKVSTKAVDDVSLMIRPGEVLGLVGESGSGKTTLGKLILGFYRPTAGRVAFRDAVISECGRREKRDALKQMSVIFQDPYSSLNPRMTVLDIVGEPLREVMGIRARDARGMVVSMLQHVGLSEDHVYRYPHEFSGGQRQRIAIARALVYSPSFVVLDEPTSGLDVSVQAQILNLLMDLKAAQEVTYLFISHNIAVVKSVCTRIAVMYLGQLVELAAAQDLFQRPLHPYTQRLLAAVPDIASKKRRTLQGLEATPENEKKQELPACHFYPKCPFAKDRCKFDSPQWTDMGNDHFVFCHTAGDRRVQ
jgi:oligopeptide/dipeptide ABC transporter ATP-binding protein